jgi:hypothetical protein
MLVMKNPKPKIRMLEGWAISVLMEAGAIRACEEHGWKKDRGDPHARELAFEIADVNRIEPSDGAAKGRFDHREYFAAARSVHHFASVVSNHLEMHALSQLECPRCPPLSSFQFPIALAVKRLRAASRAA